MLYLFFSFQNHFEHRRLRLHRLFITLLRIASFSTLLISHHFNKLCLHPYRREHHYCRESSESTLIIFCHPLHSGRYQRRKLGNSRTKRKKKNAKNFDTGNEGFRRIRKLTEKGEEENIRRLKQQRANTLTVVSCKRTDINKLMTDRRNLDVVKAELNQLDSLCQKFHDAHNLYYDELAILEEREITSRYFDDKKSNFFEHCKEVTN